ncbi:MAG: hypothetical protein ABI782_05890 [Anaerolineaceae bacterium]
MTGTTLTKQIAHVGVRFYRCGGLELALIPLLEEVASFTRSAGDGYFLVALMGEPGTSYPLNLRSRASYDPAYLGAKFKLDKRGFGYSPDELAATLRLVAEDLAYEEGMDG